ncbi:MAG: NAD(+)/NADH kinase [Phycisphaerae bacterium]
MGNPDKPDASAALDDLAAFAGARCDVVGVARGLDGRAAVDAGAERIVVIGGDGTLIGVARSLGSRQVPLIGVNVGKLGFLIEFTVDELKAHFERVVGDDALVRPRTVLRVQVQNGASRREQPAVNDCVIQAGAPFRIINLGISIDGHHLTDLGGDGLIVCTPSGSTAHNLSSGGPIMQADVDAIGLTPLGAHSLTHKPLVIERDAVIEIVARRVNEGTTAIIDGQVSCPLRQGDTVTVRRFASDVHIVRNPLYPRWHKLVTKLHWGRQPDYA